MPLDAVTDPGEGPLLILDRTQTRRAKKHVFETAPPPLSQGLEKNMYVWLPPTP